MAQIKVEDIVDHLSSEFKGALEATIREIFPDQIVNKQQLFRVFKKKIYKKCNIWETVPDAYVKNG